MISKQLDNNSPTVNLNNATIARQQLNEVFIKWKESQPRHLNQPPSQNPEVQSFDHQNPNFEDFVQSLKDKKQLILSGCLKENLKTPKIPPVITPNHEPDKEDFYWQAMLEDLDIIPTQHPRKSFDQSPKFSKDFLSQNLPTAPALRPFYTVEEAVDISNKVVASGRSNATGLKIEIKSGMNMPAWRLLLKGYKHEKMITDGLAYGWPLNWTCSPFLSCQTVPNHPTAEKQFPILIKEWYLDQVDKGMLVGPCQREDLPWANLSTIPLQSVVKDPVEMTRRICADPTYSQPGLPKGFGSLNQGIPKNSYLGEPFKYELPRVRDFVKDAIDIGLHHVLGFKIDWKFAFRQNPLDPADWWLTVYHIEGIGYFIDIRTNFGFRSAGIPQQIESECISFMLQKISLSNNVAKWFMKTFFDDEIVLVEPSIAEELYQNSIFLHNLLGIRTSTSTDHMIPPTRVLLALGVVMDFDLGVLYMPAGKEVKLRQILEELKSKETWTRKDLQRCLGLLNHWTEIIPAGRVFLNRMLPAFKAMGPSQNHFKPDEAFRKDLRWWYLVAPELNFSPMMVTEPVGPCDFIDMDASGKYGLGAVNYITKEFFMLPTPSIISDLPIHTGEMAVLMLVIDTWAGPTRAEVTSSEPSLCSKRLDLYSDNQAVIASVNYGRAQDQFLAMGTRYIHYQMAFRDSTLSITYVNTKANVFADNLSRDCSTTVHFLLSSGFRRVFVRESRLSELMAFDI